MHLSPTIAPLLILPCFCAALAGQMPAPPVQGAEAPTAFIQDIGIYGAELSRQWEGLLPSVNVPAQRGKAFPGQHLTFAVCARGKDRAHLLQDAAYSFRVEFGGVTKNYGGLHPVQIRQIKAEGADFLRSVLGAAEVETGDVDQMLSGVDLALFDLDWLIPLGAQDGEARVQATILTGDGRKMPLLDGSVQIRSFETADKEGGFEGQGDLGKWMMSYYLHPEPSRLLNAFRLAGEDKAAFRPNVITFYVEVLRSSPEAARDLMIRLKLEEKATRLYGLHLLRTANYDITPVITTLPAGERKILEALSAGIPALPDPYDLAPDTKDPYQIPDRLDMLWSTFLATGDSKPIRAVAGVLEWSRDGHSFFDRRKSGKAIDWTSPETIRGLAYGAAGWSLGSFVRYSGLVADFVEAWKQAPSTSPLLKDELNGLLTNPAFARK